MNELAVTQVLEPDLPELRQRVGGLTNQVQPFVKKQVSLKLQRIAALRVQAKVHLTARYKIKATIRHHIMQTQCNARVVFAIARHLLGQPRRCQ